MNWVGLGTDKAGGREVSAQNTGRCGEKDEGTEWKGAKTDGKVTDRELVRVVVGVEGVRGGGGVLSAVILPTHAS